MSGTGPANRMRALVVLGVVSAVGVVLAALWHSRVDLQWFDQAASTLSIAFNLTSLVLLLLSRPLGPVTVAPTSDPRAADGVAAAVRIRCQAVLSDMPHRTEEMWIRWRSAALTAVPVYVVNGRDGALCRSGGLHNMVRRFRRSRHACLAITGCPGAGKTVTAYKLVLELLLQRGDAEPVPVPMSLRGWHPAHQPLDEWLARQLHARYGGVSAAEALGLLTAGRILPVLDDVDQLPHRLQVEFFADLTRLRDAGRRIIAVSRSREYEAVRADFDPVEWTTLVDEARIDRIPAADVVRYLSAGPVRKSWDPVFDAMKEGRAEALAGVLSTPLASSLARRRYRPVERDAPPGLTTRRPEVVSAELGAELVSGTLRAANASRSGDHCPDLGYLRFLAGRSAASEDGGFHWWSLHTALPSVVVRAVFGLVAAVGTYAAAFVAGYAAEAATIGAAAFVVGAVLPGAAAPSRVHPPGRGVIVLLSGSLVSSSVLFHAAPVLPGGRAAAVVQILAVAVAYLASGGLVDRAVRTTELPREVCSRQVLRADVVAATLQMLVLAVPTLLVCSILVRWHGGYADQLRLALAAVVVLTVFLPLCQCAVGWFLTAQLLLVPAGHLPRRLHPFLDRMHTLHLLRRNGPAYQLRYDCLTDHFARLNGGPTPPV